jgi:hypothetical protein
VKLQPTIEKWSHPHGTEYAWVLGDRVLGSVVPMSSPVINQRQKWMALVGQRNVAVFTSKDGRLVAMQYVKHFTKHLWCGVQA